ncbi:AAA domain-containing protein, partial [uncultured Cardiobacterium sp.]|uniref:DEAD/DEAH box helicase n=1 Tax=uncultured Cardiobacterium sp. TaxID=417619 RepID=UPI00262F6626
MQTETLAFAQYWRNSLADAETSKGAFRLQDCGAFLQLSPETLASGIASAEIVEKCFADEKAQTHFVEIVLRPEVYCAPLQHGVVAENGNPPIITPIITPALLYRDGRIYPSAQTIMPRDILEPIDEGSFSIGSVAQRDEWLSRNPIPGVPEYDENGAPLDDESFYREWQSWLADCHCFLDGVAHDWLDNNEYQRANYGYLLKKSMIKASMHILALYDHLQKEQPAAPLFANYARAALTPTEPCLPAHSAFTERLAHASDQYPLAAAQRDALAHLLHSAHGDILAVNGPPGTGKTTLLLSVVASLWAEAALKESEPPVIVAASTNNQAVTNIIDAFGKDFARGSGIFAGRWLPDIASFGAYFPARGKEEAAAKKYQTRSFFEKVESDEYFYHAQATYLQAAANAFPAISSVQEAVNALHQALQKEVLKLQDIENAWAHLSRARNAMKKALDDNYQEALNQIRQEYKATETEKEKIDTLLDEWENYRAKESLLYAFFSWLPPVAKKRLRLARLFLKTIWPAAYAEPQGKSLDAIEAEIKTLATQLQQQLAAQAQLLARGEELKQALQQRLKEWQTVLQPLKLDKPAAECDLQECDARADTHIRFKIFQLATHYWEGRWLLEMATLLPELEKEKRKTGRKALEPRWRRRMKLTPCIVSTFFMLPNEMTVSRHEGGNSFSTDYLYDFADLLIVDEAGQVRPEVAGASFALAQKALVIGDTLQIAPIWSLPPAVDIGNMRHAGLLNGTNDTDHYQALCELGKSVAFGSVMQIAQTRSRYHYNPELARGMFLYEHRRCFDEIIAYCNTLCYKGNLQPKRGKKLQTDSLPPMGYWHIAGHCQKTNGGSRHNQEEAETIAQWLAAQRATLESFYDLPLHQIVGVVTPFGAQVRAIGKACREQGIAVGQGEDSMTVGTVHALQGAERSVIIFSPVYSKDADGGFIDSSPSML